MDGGADLKQAFGLSGEPQPPQVILEGNGTDMSASAIASLNVAKREYQKQYMDYWNSTAELSGTGRPVDGVICALAPHAAVIPHDYKYVAYTSFVNVLDYTSVSIPVTFADKNIDAHPSDASASGSEQHIEWDCKHLLFTFSCCLLVRFSHVLPTSMSLLTDGFHR